MKSKFYVTKTVDEYYWHKCFCILPKRICTERLNGYYYETWSGWFTHLERQKTGYRGGNEWEYRLIK